MHIIGLQVILINEKLLSQLSIPALNIANNDSYYGPHRKKGREDDN